jgi:Xaa-Pro aminopeptidase
MNCDYVVLLSQDSTSSNANLFYFTGFKGFGVFIIPKRGRAVLLATKLDIGNLQNKSVKAVVLEKKVSSYLSKLVKKHKRIGFDFATLDVGSFMRIKRFLKPKRVIDVSLQLLQQRAVKDKYEIQQIKKACNEICSIAGLAIKTMHKFRHEFEVRRFIDSEAKRRGYDMSFETIVASGKNAASPHYNAGTSKLKRGFLVMDCGVVVNGYCSDITRTIFLGKPSKKEKDEYTKMLSVQKKCIELARQDKPISEIDEYAHKELGKAYVHALGHGIGLDVHELPHVSIYNKEKIKDNVCFTIEPGVYYPRKFGIRIEDCLVKINGKVKNLTSSLTKKLIIINKKIYK